MENQPNIEQVWKSNSNRKGEGEAGRRDKFADVLPLKGCETTTATLFGRLIPIYFESLKNGLDDLKIALQHSGLQNCLAFF